MPVGDTGKPEGGQIAVARVHNDRRSAVHHQLYIRFDRTEGVSGQLDGERHVYQRHRGPGGRRGVPTVDRDYQPADNRMSRPGNGNERGHVGGASNTHRTFRVSAYFFVN